MITRRRILAALAVVPALLLGRRGLGQQTRKPTPGPDDPHKAILKITPLPDNTWRLFIPPSVDPRNVPDPQVNRGELKRRMSLMLTRNYFRQELSGLTCYRKTTLIWHAEPGKEPEAKGDGRDAERLRAAAMCGTYSSYGPGIGVDPVTLAENGSIYPAHDFEPWEPPTSWPEFTLTQDNPPTP
jgi:hypothetical protein